MQDNILNMYVLPDLFEPGVVVSTPISAVLIALLFFSIALLSAPRRYLDMFIPLNAVGMYTGLMVFGYDTFFMLIPCALSCLNNLGLKWRSLLLVTLFLVQLGVTHKETLLTYL